MLNIEPFKSAVQIKVSGLFISIYRLKKGSETRTKPLPAP